MAETDDGKNMLLPQPVEKMKGRDHEGTVNTQELQEPIQQAEHTAPPDVRSSETTDAADNRESDSSDARFLGFGKSVSDTPRPTAGMPVASTSTLYNMSHKSRGTALLLVYEHYTWNGPPKRDSARADAEVCRAALKKLGFDIEEHWNLEKDAFRILLKKVSQQNHADSDALVVVFMSHGGVNERNKEYLWTYDGQVDTTDLWKNFTANNCPTLAGKPKMFFIQACRGEETDKGVQLKRPKALSVQTDSAKDTEQYVIPQHADMLMMWASYPGMFAFKSKNNGINGSVFIHFLAQVLREDAATDDLATMLLRVTREVAVEYEAYVPGNLEQHRTKQIPYTVSTLMRKVFFIKNFEQLMPPTS